MGRIGGIGVLGVVMLLATAAASAVWLPPESFRVLCWTAGGLAAFSVQMVTCWVLFKRQSLDMAHRDALIGRLTEEVLTLKNPFNEPMLRELRMLQEIRDATGGRAGPQHGPPVAPEPTHDEYGDIGSGL